MDATLIAARLLLAIVFVVAGLAKLADRTGTRKAIVDFGVPAPLATPLALCLPFLELGVAIALLFAGSAWWGALGALALLLLFIAAIVYNLARGRRPDCHCFGQLHSEPVGWQTLIRNGILAAIAVFVTWQARTNPGWSAFGWLGTLSVAGRLAVAAGAVLVAVLVVQWWLLMQMLQQNGRLLVRLGAVEHQLGIDGWAVLDAQQAGRPLGASAPGFALPSLDGGIVTLSALCSRGKPVILIFTDPSCGPCLTLLPEIGRWQREHVRQLTIAVISRGSLEDNRSKRVEHGLTNVLLQQDFEVYNAYQGRGTPSAIIIQPDGTIGSLMAAGPAAIRALLTRTVGKRSAPALLPVLPTAEANGKNGHTQQANLGIGDVAPAFTLPDLAGTTVSLADFRGTDTLVLFWSPTCGFCQRMLPDLTKWLAKPREDAPRLLVVSTGTFEANEAQRIQATVVLDAESTVARAFGADATPMAVLVDADGRIASSLSTGVQEVLALAQTSRQPLALVTMP